ncbi:MAG: hypothetical protein KKB31_06645, partial [Nanoarchaeota archaeon]|nr:hypothetical protein [Nanoarchaeota archaeon]
MKIIGICGPSNSGKSTLCEELEKKYNIARIELDHYLKNIEEIPMLGDYHNWELPENHKFEDLIKNIKDLKEGKTIIHPIYDFKKGKVKGYREI